MIESLDTIFAPLVVCLVFFLDFVTPHVREGWRRSLGIGGRACIVLSTTWIIVIFLFMTAYVLTIVGDVGNHLAGDPQGANESARWLVTTALVFGAYLLSQKPKPGRQEEVPE